MINEKKKPSILQSLPIMVLSVEIEIDVYQKIFTFVKSWCENQPYMKVEVEYDLNSNEIDKLDSLYDQLYMKRLLRHVFPEYTKEECLMIKGFKVEEDVILTGYLFVICLKDKINPLWKLIAVNSINPQYPELCKLILDVDVHFCKIMNRRIIISDINRKYLCGEHIDFLAAIMERQMELRKINIKRAEKKWN